jgi:pyruvate formate lyase activating enzyme
VPGRRLDPEEITALAREEGVRQIAYTYSEPLVHIEYLLDCMEAAHEEGLANVLVSNGCIREEGAEAVLALTDAVNIDLKGFSEDTYTRLLGGNLPTVLDFIKTAFIMGVLTEVSTLFIPALNDSEVETAACTDFLAGLSPAIPWHLSAYHPAYRWKAPPTEASRLLEIARRARKVLSFVYTGNISPREEGFTDTLCPQCGAVLVKRKGYQVDTGGLVLKNLVPKKGASSGGAPQKEEPSEEYRCGRCGSPAPFVFRSRISGG